MIILFSLVAILILFFCGMNLYVRYAVKKRMKQLMDDALMNTSTVFNYQKWSEEMDECKEWLYHGWPEPGCLYQGSTIGGYGFPYIRPKCYLKF